MSHYTTTHNSNNQSIFTPNSHLHHRRPTQTLPNTTTIETIYTLPTFPPNLSTENDITTANPHLHDAAAPLTALLASFPPGATTPFHRTPTLNVGIVLQGALRLHLDSGESRTLRAGDSYTQRGTMHRWENVGEEWVKVVTVTVPVVKPVVVNGVDLEADGKEWSEVLEEVMGKTDRGEGAGCEEATTGKGAFSFVFLLLTFGGGRCGWTMGPTDIDFSARSRGEKKI